MSSSVRYREICDALKDEILSGKYASARSFPSSIALSRRFKTTRATIRRAIDQLRSQGFIGCRKGSGTFLTKSGASRKIGLIVPALPKVEIFSTICHEISSVCQEHDRLVLFADEKADAADKVGNRLKKLAEKFIEDGVAGIVFHPVDYCPNASRINREIVGVFARANIPVVLLDCDLEYTLQSSGLDQVGVDNVEVGWKLGRHVVEKGAKRILFVMRTKWSVNVWKRLLGLKSAAEGCKGVKVGEYFLDTGSREAFLKLLRRKCPDAIVCSSDAVAANVLKLVEKAGKSSPKDVLVAGINDIEIARITSPSLTTVRQPCADIARAAIETLEWRMLNPDAKPRQVWLPTELVVRDSTGRGDRA